VRDGAVVVPVQGGDGEAETLGEEADAGVDVGEADAGPDGGGRGGDGSGARFGDHAGHPASSLGRLS
jgi:hypothetical protein